MLDMSHPWWEYILRAVVVFMVLLLLVRISGKRTVGQFTPFDLLVVMLMAEGVTNSLTGGDESLPGGLIVAATLIMLNMALAFGSARSRTFSDIVEGTSTLLGRDGKLYDDVMKKNRVAQEEVEQALREADCPLKDARCIFLESDGKITVLST